jgi:hypothetical protein
MAGEKLTAAEQAQLLADALALEYAMELIVKYHRLSRFGKVPDSMLATRIGMANAILGDTAYRLRRLASVVGKEGAGDDGG